MYRRTRKSGNSTSTMSIKDTEERRPVRGLTRERAALRLFRGVGAGFFRVFVRGRVVLRCGWKGQVQRVRVFHAWSRYRGQSRFKYAGSE